MGKVIAMRRSSVKWKWRFGGCGSKDSGGRCCRGWRVMDDGQWYPGGAATGE
ncbi:hypothetical protein Syun_017419 [Stephania yunnanensis]|uniref:Uncharacterized protein n=1 Tax=Stephania yunnanensis TaxID=152371 RepID=A0AAP0J6I2_9MAGN